MGEVYFVLGFEGRNGGRNLKAVVGEAGNGYLRHASSCN